METINQTINNMATKKLKYIDLLALDAELHGFYRPAEHDSEGVQLQPEIKITGILSSLPAEINFILKYRLDKFIQAVGEVKKELTELQIELARKYGKEGEDGIISIEQKIKDEPNPDFIKFNEENTALLQEEFELTYKPLPLKEMGSIVNNQNYSILYDFIED